MKTFTKRAAQGDVFITKIDELPEDAIKATETSNEDIVIAHSETGHHHVVEANAVDYFHAANDGKVNEFVSYLRVKEDTSLRHLRSFYTHEAIELLPGLYRINRQREYTPEGFRKAQD